MKIALFHELTLGGARTLAEEQAKYLTGKNQVDIYYVDFTKGKENIVKNLKYFYFNFTPIDWKGKSPFKKIYKDSFELLILYLLHKKIAKIINKKKYDVVLVHPSKMTQAPFILRFLKQYKIYYCEEPLRIVYDSLFSLPKNLNFFKKIYESINRLNRKIIDINNFKKATKVLSNSIFSKIWIQRAYNTNNVDVCYPGIDAFKYKNLNIKKEYDLLFFGGKDFIEGYDLLEEILNKYNNKLKVKQIFRNINGIGISNNELVKMYNKSKIVLCLARSEPLGLVPLEAMGCGTPVIAIAEGGHNETVVNNISGYLIKRDGNALYSKIAMLLADEKLRNKIGNAGRKIIINKWLWNKNIKELEKFLKYND
jgi:glycosyltransferase involved in cell wall biosynthesis